MQDGPSPEEAARIPLAFSSENNPNRLVRRGSEDFWHVNALLKGISTITCQVQIYLRELRIIGEPMWPIASGGTEVGPR